MLTSHDEHGAGGVIHNLTRNIAKNVCAESAARGGTGDDEVVIALFDFPENLLQHRTMAEPHFDGHGQGLEQFFAAPKVSAEFRFGLQEGIRSLVNTREG